MIGGGTLSKGVDEFLRSAVDGDGRACIRLALDLLDQGVPADQIIVDLLAEAQREVGERWMRNDWTVADEHLATSSAQKALDALANTVEPPEPLGLVVVACAEGDWHSLPAQMFAELLRLRGIAVLFLGSSTPADHVAALLSRRRADALVVSCSLPIFYRGVTRLADAAHHLGLPVIAGGRALGEVPARALRLGADASAFRVDEAEIILRGWLQARPSVSVEPTKLDRSALGLDLEASRIADQGFVSLTTSYPDDQRALTKVDLTFIVQFIAAARLAGDPDVFSDFLEWEQTVLANRGVPPTALKAGIAALEPFLSRMDPRVGAMARDALPGV
jgi:methanogenic corrinoid protein MtbC1